MKTIVILILCLVTQSTYANDEYYNPIDGKTYIGDWKKYGSEKKTDRESGRVVNLGVRLMNTDADLKRNTTAQEIAKLVQEIEQIFMENVDGYNEEGEILVQVTLGTSNVPSFEMSYKGDLNKDYLQKSKDAFSNLKYQTKESEITLQVHLKIRNA